MPRNCPSCGTVNYDDVADTCINCSTPLPPVEPEEDLLLDELEKELEGLTEVEETVEETDDDDSLFFTEETDEEEETPAQTAPSEDISIDDFDELLDDPATPVSEPKEESVEETDDDDSLFFTEENEEQEEQVPPSLEHAPQEPEVQEEEDEYEEEALEPVSVEDMDLESPYGTPEPQDENGEQEAYEEPDIPQTLEHAPQEEEYVVPEEIGGDYAAPLEADEEYVEEEVYEEEVEYEQQPQEVEYEEDIQDAAPGMFGDQDPVQPALGEEEETTEAVSEDDGISRSQKKKNKKKDKRAAKIEAMERELKNIEGLDESEATPAIFWVLNMVSLFFFVFLAIFVVAEFLLLMFNISATAPAAIFALSPVVGDTLDSPILFLAVVLAGMDGILHLWDKKINLMFSFLPTGLMIAGLGIGLYEGYVGDVDSLSGILLLFALFTFLAIDVIAWLQYPDFLSDVGRESMDMYIEANQKLGDIKSEIEEEYQDILAEEEEKLRLKEEEINDIKSEIETLSNQLSEEEEKIRLKDEEIASIQTELEVKKEDLMEEEEKLRLKEESLDSVVRAEVERYSQDWVAEEEEKIRIKEEELAHTRSDLDIQKSMAEDMKERLRMKEYELNNVRNELETQLRNRMEEEEMLRIKETAARMGEKDKKQRTLFPFTAMVGQFKMKSALTLNAIYPGVGGVLIRGQKGTGKSVTVRGLAEVLPSIKVTGCKFNCDPEDETTLCYECRRHLDLGKLETYERPVQVVDLPLNVTEDRLVGSIDIEKILSEGTKSFEPGILAEAHRGILYVDEINLLDDYIVDILLDAASSGQVVIEREGVSVNHPSHFIIVGSMNPEEGELRPQILDRIALQTDVVGIHEIESRMDIVKRRDEFTKNPDTFRAKFEPEQENLRRMIEEARKIMPSVTTPDRMLTLIARLCVDFDVDGHRADIIIERASRANAAFEKRLEVTSEDVVAAAEMALPHRMRKRPYAEERFDAEVLQKWVKKIESEV